MVDNPEQLTSQVSPCDVNNPYQHRFRFNGSYELPWGGVQLAAVYQDLPGPLIAANRTYTSAEINAQATGALGRTLRLATRTIDMLEPFSLFGDRVRQLDMRVSKLFRLGRRSGSRPTWTSTMWPTRARRRSSGTPILPRARSRRRRGSSRRR